MREQDFEIIEKNIPYQGYFRVVKYQLKHRLFQGGWTPVHSREVFERPSAVAVLPYDPVLNRVLLIEQFRPGPLGSSYDPWLIEIVAGCYDTGDDLKETAKRESFEEAGCKIEALYLLCDYFVSPGGSNELLHVYIGKTDASKIKGIHGLEDENEDIRVLNLSLDEALALMHANKIKTSPAILSLQWLEYNRDQLLKLWQNEK